MSQITTKEIANLAGVSVGTVDRVIHNRGQVADKTRKKFKRLLIKMVINQILLQEILYKRKN